MGRIIRGEVQGLRAVSVAAVFAYHLGWPLHGGFLGVDVFLVISGFVIGLILFEELDRTGAINWKSFLLRRVTRLLPALALVILVSALAATLVFTSTSLRETTLITGLGALVGLSNFLIADISGGYFGRAPNLNPLVHTWSLSVEWQFYLLLVVVLSAAVILARRVRRSRRLVSLTFLGLLSGGSFIFMLSTASANAQASGLIGFYSVFPRLWEFGVGVFIAAIGRISVRARTLPVTLSSAGFIALVASFFFLSEDVLTPGLSTLLPVGGVAAIILSGSMFQGALAGPVLRGLTLKPVQWVGDISYSIYLWHWPILFFAKEFGFPNNPQRAFWVIILTLALSIFSYYFVETRFRLGKRVGTPPRLTLKFFALVVSPLVFSGAWAVGGAKYDSFLEGRGIVGYTPGLVGHDTFHEIIASEYVECEPKAIREGAEYWKEFLRCQQSRPGEAQSVAIIGDSHAEHLFPGLASALPDETVVYFQYDRFPVNLSAPQTQRILQYLRESPTISNVVFTAYWAKTGVPSHDVAQLVKDIARSGKRVILTTDIPIPPFSPEDCKVSKFVFSEPRCSYSLENQRLRFDETTSQLMSIADNQANVFLADTFHEFCDTDVCSVVVEGEVAYRDNDHLNFLGSDVAARVILSHMAP